MRRPPFLRLLLLGAVVLAGVALFLALSPRAEPLVTPTALVAEP